MIVDCVVYMYRLASCEMQAAKTIYYYHCHQNAGTIFGGDYEGDEVWMK